MGRLLQKNRKIKYAQIILSAISTGGFLGAIITNEKALTCIGGLFSTALLALNLFFEDLNLVEEIKQHRTASDSLWVIREDYISLLTDFSILNETDIMVQRGDLQKRVAEIYKTSPKTDKKGYADAQIALKSEEE